MRLLLHIFTLTIISIVLVPLYVEAAIVDVKPAVLNFKTLPRDIIADTITVTNTSGHRLDLYATVNNVNPVEGEEAFQSLTGEGLSDSLANWIEISRSVLELDAGETIEIPLTIRVNLRAEPRPYHAFIHFSNGRNRREAENNIRNGETLAVNVEVIENIKERLQLGAFTSNKVFFSGPEVSFAFDLENIGNRSLSPQGEVRIYDRRGREVDSISVNDLETTINPDASTQLAAIWNAGNFMGRYKAYLDLEYGSSQQGSLNDTVYFWIIPWQRILLIFVVLSSVIGGGTYVWFDRAEKRRLSQQGFAYAEANKYPTGSHVVDMRR